MSLQYIPNTSVAASVIDPSTPMGYVPLYLDAGENCDGFHVATLTLNKLD